MLMFRIVLFLLPLTAMVLACDYDDPEDPDPGDPSAQVDFIRFSTPGVFKEYFVDLTFQSGEFAMDVLGDQQPRVWRLGPGSDQIPGTDADAVPYPNLAGRRKQTEHNGEWDRRLWVQFAGGAWNSLGIKVDDDRSIFRASAAPPVTIPKTVFLWCPGDGSTWTLPCRTWLNAVARREVRCFRYTVNGFEQPVSPETCLPYHPRIFWRVSSCDDCPIPAVSEYLSEE